MAKRSNDEEVDFGTVILDTDVDDITAPWRKLIKGTVLEDLDCVEKFCLYLTLYNNFLVEHKDSYPKRISTVDTYGAFITVLLDIAVKHEDETIKDIKPLFEFWIEFLNDNVDTFDRFSENKSWDVAQHRFSILISDVLENEETEENI